MMLAYQVNGAGLRSSFAGLFRKTHLIAYLKLVKGVSQDTIFMKINLPPFWGTNKSVLFLGRQPDHLAMERNFMGLDITPLPPSIVL